MATESNVDYDSEAEVDLLESLDSLQEEADQQQKAHQAHLLEDRHNKCATIIQNAWRKHHQEHLYSMTKDINLMHSIRANPFDIQSVEHTSSPNTTSPETPFLSDDRSAARQSILLDEELLSAPSPTEEPTFHLATLAAQLYSVDAREQHLEQVLVTRQVNDYPSDDEDESGSNSSSNPDLKRLGGAYSSMQICFVGNSKEKCDDVPSIGETTSGRESRGAADGASTGEPATQEELDGELERSTTPLCNDVSNSDVPTGSLKQSLIMRTVGSATPTQDMEWVNDDDEDDDCLSTQFGLRMWRRSEQQLTSSQLHCLNFDQLVVLRNELQHLVRMTSDELVNLLTLRDSLACQRDEFNVYFDAYSQQMEKRYRRAAVKGNSPGASKRKRIPWFSGYSS